MRTKIIIVAILLVALVIVGISLIRTASTSAVLSRDLSNLKELGVAITLFQQRHLETYPESLNSSEFQPYLKPHVISFIGEGKVVYNRPPASALNDFEMLILSTPQGDWICTKGIFVIQQQ